MQSNTLLLTDVFKSFYNKFVEIYKFDRTRFLSTPGFTWKACLKWSELQLELLANVDMVLMLEKGIRDRDKIFQAIHYTQKLIINS